MEWKYKINTDNFDSDILGFTLVELLGVVILLTVISLLTIPAVNNSIRKNKEKLYQSQLENIKNGLKNWAIDNNDSLPSSDNDVVTLTLGQLKQGNYIDSKIKNPKTKSCFPNDMLVTITNYDGTYLYTVIEDSGTNNNTCDTYSSTAPRIFLYGNALEYVDLNDYYYDNGVYALTNSGSIISSITKVIKNNGVEVSSIDTSSPALYTITYSVTDNGETTEVTRTIIVKDMTPPLITVPENIAISVDDISSFNVMEGVSATDNSGETINVTSSGNLNNLKGKYTIVYTAVDSTGNVSTKKRVITVVDNIFEVVAKDSLYSITANSSNDIFKTYFYINNVGYTLKNSSCIDTSNGNVAVTNTSKLALGMHNITCTINSNEGKTSSASTTINVVNVFEIVAKNNEYLVELKESNDIFTKYFEVDDSANSLKSSLCTDKYNGGTVITNTSQLGLGSHVVACQINNDSTTSIAYTTIKIYQKGVDKLKENLVDSNSGESGLYLDSDGVYRYKGLNPDNYIMLGEEEYRILAIEEQGIKVIRSSNIVEAAFDKGFLEISSCTDSSCPRYNGNNTYCQALEGSSSYFGCDIWSTANTIKQNNTISNIITNGSISGTVTQNSTSYTYLHDEYYQQYLISLDEYIEKEATWYIGPITLNESGMLLDTIKQEEQQWTWTGKIGLLRPSDYITTQLPSGEGYTSCSSNIYANTNCGVNSWLKPSSGFLWTMNPRTDYAYIIWTIDSDGNLNRYNAGRSYGLRPVVYLKSDIQLSGSGTQGNNAYKVVES